MHQRGEKKSQHHNGSGTHHHAYASIVGTSSVVQQHVDRLLSCVQPNGQSELRRYAVGNYVCDLIKRCFHGKHGIRVDAFMFGSVPLKAYLPDGDVDISIFIDNSADEGVPSGNDGYGNIHRGFQSNSGTVGTTSGVGSNGFRKETMSQTWALELKKFLDAEMTHSLKNHRHQSMNNNPLEFQDVQIIQAEVKLVKCIVSGLEVDVSFNALGGLCAVAFLEWFDRMIGRSHLLKKSILLVKAWCYYESRLLGAHHGLLSSYALEVMVLFIVNIYGSELASPLEVFQRFLEVFAEFDFDTYCLSMLGPIPLESFPSPHIDEQQLPPCQMTVSATSLRDAVMQYSAKPREATSAVECLSPELSCSSVQSPNIQLMKKHLNIMDPLLPSNNLGRSVSRSSYMRMKMAFSHGVTSLNRVLQSEPSIASQKISLFFSHTWNSTHRMVMENRMFTAMTAGLPPEYLMIPNNQIQSNRTHHEKKASLDLLPRIGGSMSRRVHGSTASLPDLSNVEPSPFTEKSKGRDEDGKSKEDSAQLPLDDSLEAHDGTSISPVKRRSEDDLHKMDEAVQPVSQFGSERSLDLVSANSDKLNGRVRPLHRRSNSMTSTISIGSGKTVIQITPPVHAINFISHSAVSSSNSMGDTYATNMHMLMNNIAVARKCQPSSPMKSNATSESKQHQDPQISPVIKHLGNDTLNFSDKGKEDPDTSGTSTTLVRQSSTITYASVTANGLTPTARSRAISRRDSMSVNASLSVSPPTSEHTPRAGLMSDRRLTSEMISSHLSGEHRALPQAGERAVDLEKEPNQGVDAHSLSSRLKTWSIVAQQPPQQTKDVPQESVKFVHPETTSEKSAEKSHSKEENAGTQPKTWAAKLSKTG